MPARYADTAALIAAVTVSSAPAAESLVTVQLMEIALLVAAET